MKNNSPVFDLHCDTILRCIHEGTSLCADNTRMHIDIPKMRQGNVNGLFLALWVDAVFKGDDAVKQADKMIDFAHNEMKKCAKDIHFCESSADAEIAEKNGKISAFFGIEGGIAINNDLGNLRRFYDKGVRCMTLTHVNNIDWAGSCNEKDNKGLSDFGKDVVTLMNELGMIIDLAHTSERTLLDAIKVSKKPVIVSHGGARKVFDINRLSTDEMISAVGETGGLFGVMMLPMFFAGSDKEANERWMESMMSKMKGLLNGVNSPEEAARKNLDMMFGADLPERILPIENSLPHFDRIIDLIGEDHVAIGTDFDGMPFGPVGLEHAGKFDNLREAMKKHGYTDMRIQKILGGNARRVLSEILS